MIDDCANPIEIAENNVDWFATAAIYENETDVLPLWQKRGFCGTVTLTVDVTTTAFCRKTSKHGHYRYFTLAKPPILKIALEYVYENMPEVDDDIVLPQKVMIQWVYYPDEFAEEKLRHTSWLSKKCEEQLNSEVFSSFDVVEFCEHEALSYWEMVNQTRDYRLLLLPPKMDCLHHSNVGVLMHPHNEAIERQRGHPRLEEYVMDEFEREEEESDEEEAVQLATPRNAPSCIQEYAKMALLRCWRKIYEMECPICFDVRRCSEGMTLTCGHFFCEDCFPVYLHVKVTELSEHRKNPFLCPVPNCRARLSIEQTVKRHISKQDVKEIERWQKDLEFPPCHLLDRCPSKSCASNKSKMTEDYCMRRFSMQSRFVFCEVCDKTWCELCMRRVHDNVTANEHNNVCEMVTMVKFCRRYLRASVEMKEKCETMYPWICTYARGIQDDVGALAWLSENGQRCPNCATGVERISGCFHMKCPNCASHFCYECGVEIFAPFYGTHHCWEEELHNGD